MSVGLCGGRLVAVSRIALVSLIGASAAACSTDTLRFAETPFSNPFGASERVAANQTQPAQTSVPAMRTSPVQSQALPPIASQSLPPVQSHAPYQPQPARVAAAPASGSAGWTSAGGTPIVVGSSDSLTALSQRYGIPANAILSANGLTSPSQVAPGRQIVIPVYSATAQSTRVAAVRQAPPAPQPKFRLVENAKPEKAEVPRPHARPGTAQVASSAAPAPVAALPKRAEPQRVASRPEPQTEKPAARQQPVQEVAAARPEPVRAAPREPEQTASLPGPTSDFRWPARGRVIAGFGANGGNEGINIAVPEGTPVKATEAGVVTYAGSEVKGYGNLVLIRHENGYVSAYAHNGDLSVKRGDPVKRGQVIAHSGQSGNVTSPQLHFELRKGQQPVDPIAHLSGN
jgi:murein DD-endopeptidase MepM/ murein hydrolase activator NlpD